MSVVFVEFSVCVFRLTWCYSREASLPEKGATEATSCSTTYDWILGQILTRCREEGCQKSLRESSVKEKTRLYHEENLTVEE